jgi:hypothetical protein
VHSVAVERSGAVTAVGKASDKFPVTPGAYDVTFNGPTADAFVSRFGPKGERLWYSTYLGGAKEFDRAFGVKIGPLGQALVVGWTNAYDFPTTTGAFQTQLGGKRDGFLAELDMLPTGVQTYGTSTPACSGEIYMGVTSWPKSGNTGFALTCNGAPPGAGGLFLAGVALPNGGPVLGIRLYLNPTMPLVAAFVNANLDGFIQVPLPIPAGIPTGTKVAFQHVWINPKGCGTGLLSASHGLEITVQ